MLFFKTLLMQKSKIEDGHVWILGPGTFRVIGLLISKCRLLSSFNNRICRIDGPIPRGGNAKLEYVENGVFVLSDFDDEVYSAFVFHLTRHLILLEKQLRFVPNSQ